MNWEYTHDEHPEVVLVGRGVSSGIAFARVHVNARGFSAPETYSIYKERVSAELKRLNKAILITKGQLEEIKNSVGNISSEAESQIFDAHLLILEDKSLLKKVEKRVKERLVNVDYAYYSVIQEYMEALRRSQDSYLAERAVDLEDVAMRLLDNLGKGTEHCLEVDEDHILVSYDLTPSDTISLDRQKMLGFATEQGSYTSHTAILARSLGIPAVVGVEAAVMKAVGLSQCIIDGAKGLLILHPTLETFQKYKERYEESLSLRARLEEESSQETKTTDGHNVTLSSNVEFAYEVDLLKKNGAEGIGLYRTEFYLLENEKIPNEDEQAALYSKVASEVHPGMAVFRTLDSGGDKMSGEPLEEPEPNPFLGWRGIRFSLARPELFKVQLRALLRATAHGNVGIMFPMISQINEIRQAKELLQECEEQLRSEGVAVGDSYQVGAMIEVPSAALIADEMAKEVDFFSIGTNDLIQYTTAVDRVNPLVSNLYRPADPGVLRLMKMTVEGGKKAGIWTGVCGEMASDLELLPLLVGLGMDELSVGVNKVPAINSALRKLSYEECKNMVAEAFTLTRAIEIRALSRQVAEGAYPELLAQEASSMSH